MGGCTIELHVWITPAVFKFVSSPFHHILDMLLIWNIHKTSLYNAVHMIITLTDYLNTVKLDVNIVRCKCKEKYPPL